VGVEFSNLRRYGYAVGISRVCKAQLSHSKGWEGKGDSGESLTMFGKNLNIKRKISLFALMVFVGIASFFAGFNGLRFLDNLPLEINYESINKIKKGAPKAFVVYSGSMSPALPAGSLIAVKPEENYSVGDVVSFKRSREQIVTHRIAKVLQDESSGGAVYETKGDANNAIDRELISKEQILGEGFFALPYLGYPLSFMKTKTGYIFLVIIPAILIILGEILNIKTEIYLLINERRTTKISGRKSSFSFRSLLFLLIVPLLTIGASNAYFSDKETSPRNIMSAAAWGDEEWDKSSLYFDDEYGCHNECQQIQAKVCNGNDSEDMMGSVSWELYWIEKGNPKNGIVIESGLIDPLSSGECQILQYIDNNSVNGNYMFKSYQRPGHPGVGELWSEECSMQSCEISFIF